MRSRLLVRDGSSSDTGPKDTEPNDTESSEGVMVEADVDQAEDHMSAGSLCWLDVTCADADTLDELGERFSFDPAAIEDILDIEQLPKFDDYDDHLFVVLHALTSEEDRVDTIEVDCFVSRNLLVTVSAQKVKGIDWLWEAVQTHGHLVGNGSDEVFAQLTEVIGRRYLEIIVEFERRIDEIYDDALAADPDVLADIQVMRREETAVRKVLRPQRLVLANLRRSTVLSPGLSEAKAPISLEAKVTLGDSFDVHNQVVESLAEARALLSDALDTYRGAAADRQATATMVLAVYSAIMLPLTLITGWYGMNIALPGNEARWGWEIVLAAMIVIAIGSFVAFVKAGFIRAPSVRQSKVLRGLANAARAPVRPVTMLRNPRRNPR